MHGQQNIKIIPGSYYNPLLPPPCYHLFRMAFKITAVVALGPLPLSIITSLLSSRMLLYIIPTTNDSDIHLYLKNASSSVGIASDYGLDGPGSNPCRDEVFSPSRLVLVPTQPPAQWVPVLSRG